MIEYDVAELKRLISESDPSKISAFMCKHDLILDEQTVTIRPRDQKPYKEKAVFWDQRQLALKILLNSLYGALLNEGLRFYDERLGQSTTLTGRSIVRHMNAKINEIITGTFDYAGDGIVYADTDSNPADTIVHTNNGRMTMEGLFELAAKKWKKGDKEYAADERLQILSYDPKIDRALFKPFSYVYRHRVSKARWSVTDELGNTVELTNDHSIMIERNGVLSEAKASDIKMGDVFISVEIEK